MYKIVHLKGQFTQFCYYLHTLMLFHVFFFNYYYLFFLQTIFNYLAYFMLGLFMVILKEDIGSIQVKLNLQHL